MRRQVIYGIEDQYSRIVSEAQAKPKKYVDLKDCEEDDLYLLKAIARTDSITRPGVRTTVIKRYTPILKHPLPLSSHRYKHEAILRRVKSCPLEQQARAAVAAGDAWVLEEIYMQGAPVEVKDENGFTPAHIACQLNNFDILMVLLNIGVDINSVSLAGYTPLFMAHAAGSKQAIIILEENGAKLHIPDTKIPTSCTFLDVESNTSQSVLKINAYRRGLPHEHKTF